MNQRNNRYLSILIIMIIALTMVCLFNKTCFRRNYTKTIKDQEIEIGVPFFSYFTDEQKSKDIYTIHMTTLREVAVVKEEIVNYLDTLVELKCQKGYYYDKTSDVTIQKYNITKEGFWISNTITLSYSLGQFCIDEPLIAPVVE